MAASGEMILAQKKSGPVLVNLSSYKTESETEAEDKLKQMACHLDSVQVRERGTKS